MKSIDDLSKMLNVLVRNAEANFGRQCLSHHYVPVSTLEECVVKVDKENKRKLFARQLTPRKQDVTLRNT